MISVVITSLNAERTLPATLYALIPAAVEGVVGDVIVVDGGSTDGTRAIADSAGADFVVSEPGRGRQLALGASRARGQWVLFLHADTVLDEYWMRAASDFMRAVDQGEVPPSAAAFRFALDDRGPKPRLLELIVRLRCWLLRLPFGDQGLLISKRLYQEIGGYRPMVLMEDVDLVHRIGRARMTLLDAKATTSAERYRRDGYIARILRNQVCLAMYVLGASPERIGRIYRGREATT